MAVCCKGIDVRIRILQNSVSGRRFCVVFCHNLATERGRHALQLGLFFWITVKDDQSESF